MSFLPPLEMRPSSVAPDPAAPTSNTEEAEVERFYEDLQDLLEHPKKVSFSLYAVCCSVSKS